jgi:leucyl aminopeptidase
LLSRDLKSNTFQPLQVREEVKSRSSKVKALHVWCSDKKRLQYLMQTGLALEQGRLVNCLSIPDTNISLLVFFIRFVARDLGGGDPERMSPPHFAHHLVDLFAKSKNIKISVISDQKELEKIYPLFGAVNRAASSKLSIKSRLKTTKVVVFYGNLTNDRCLEIY